MEKLLLTNIQQLAQVEHTETYKTRVMGHDMSTLPSLYNAWLYIENKTIIDFGEMASIPYEYLTADTLDCEGKIVLPAWCDSHTHLVFAAPREQEFVDKIKGLSYEEIARKGGGILNSAAKVQDCEEEELYDLAWKRLEEVISLGTGAIEIKSGYGLTTDAELKMLRVIRKLKEESPIPIKATFLAAHAFPLSYKENQGEYIRLIIHEMLPKVASEGLADYMDVFCEKGFFSVEQTAQLLDAGWKYGLKPKIHANQLHCSGGVQVGVKYNAISVDHLESMGQAEIEVLQNSTTIPTVLPGAAFFLKMQYQPAREMLNANLPVCVASDFNPGSCPTGNMNVMLSLACTQLKMTPEEAVNAQTINGAAAMELTNEVGSIAKGKKAHLIITKPVPSLAYLPYSYGSNLIERVII